MKRTTTLAVAAALALAVGGASRAQETAKPNPLVGSWKLNESLSKGPDGSSPSSGWYGRERARGPRAAQPPEQGGGQALGGPFATPQGQTPPPPGGPGGPGWGTGERGGRRGRSPMGALQAMRLVIENNTLRIETADGTLRTQPLDGSPVSNRGRHWQGETKATVKGSAIVLTTTSPTGRVITETYAMAEDGSGRLVHTIDAAGGGNPAAVARWVYDREVEAAQPDASAAEAKPAATEAKPAPTSPAAAPAPAEAPAATPAPTPKQPGK